MFVLTVAAVGFASLLPLCLAQQPPPAFRDRSGSQDGTLTIDKATQEALEHVQDLLSHARPSSRSCAHVCVGVAARVCVHRAATWCR